MSNGSKTAENGSAPKNPNKIASRNGIQRLVLASLFLAIGLTLPFLTGNIPAVGKALLPMHLAVTLCGFFCGPWYGLAVGAVCPVMRALLFGAPLLFPDSVCIAPELAVLGFLTGFLFFRAKRPSLAAIYFALGVGMISCRLVWGAVKFAVLGFSVSEFPFYEGFLMGAVIKAAPGILLQLILVPIIIKVLNR